MPDRGDRAAEQALAPVDDRLLHRTSRAGRRVPTRCRRCRRRRSSAPRAWRCSRSPRRCRCRSRRPTSCSPSRRCCGSRMLVRNHERIEVPPMFWPLAAYGGRDARRVGLLGRPAGQPGRLEAARAAGHRAARLPAASADDGALLAVDVIITVGAMSATFGIVQYLILNYDHLGRRPQGTLGLYMTYSGLLMLVACAAVSRVMFAKHHRDVGGAGAAGAAARARLHVHAQRLGRRVRRDRPALPAARLPAAGAAAGRVSACFLVVRARRPDDAPLLDLQPDGSVQRRPRRDDEARACTSSRTTR